MLFILVTPDAEFPNGMAERLGMAAPDFSAPIEVTVTGSPRDRADATLGAISPGLVGVDDGSVQVCLAGAAADGPAPCFVRVAVLAT